MAESSLSDSCSESKQRHVDISTCNSRAGALLQQDAFCLSLIYVGGAVLYQATSI